MNRLLQLYIGSERIDLFNDETVSVTDTIQNVKDISKIFTPFSQSFSVPASKTNNKIFKHYYNFDIDDGFDARKKVTSTLEINNQTFRKGKIKLEGVDLKNNKPHTYRITFFGNLVSMKDLLGDSELSDLSFSDLDRLYSPTNIVNVSSAFDNAYSTLVLGHKRQHSQHR
jgi:phage terminase large subunit